MKAIKPVTHSLSESALKNLYPKYSDVKTWCIYTLEESLSKQLYYGSSINLGLRLRHYLRNHSAPNLRLILHTLRSLGLNRFKLHIREIPMHLRDQRLLLALEQYYILSENPMYNLNLVVNWPPGGMQYSEINSKRNSVPIYASLNGKLIYVFDSLNGITNSAVKVLGASTNKIISCLNTGELYIGSLELSRLIPIEYDEALIDTNEMKGLVKNLRSSKLKPTDPITVIRVSDNTIKHFPNRNEARVWVREQIGIKVNNATLNRRIVSGIPLNGFQYKSST